MPPLVSVVLATRNRPEAVPDALRFLLANVGVHFEVVVVDQSDDEVTRTALSTGAGDPRVRYLRSAGRGLASARNEGIAAARAELVAMTDDDCEVPPDWLASMVAALQSHPRVGVVFGN